MAICRRILLTYVRLCTSLLLHFVFISIVITRVVQSSDWPWAAVFSPLFLFDFICVIYLFIYAGGLIRDKIEGDPNEHNTSCFPHQVASPVPLTFYIVGLLIKVIAEVLLVVHLSNGSIPFYVSSIFIMLFLLVLSCGMFVYSIKPTVEWWKENRSSLSLF